MNGSLADYVKVSTYEFRRDLRHDCIAVAPQESHATGYPVYDKLPQDCSHAGARTVDGRCENCGQSL